MRRLSVAILLLLTACLFRLSAFEIMPETGSVSTFVVNGNDTLLFFSGAIELKTDDDSKVDWYRLSDLVNPVATNSSTCYMFNSGDGVYAKAADGTVATCCVFDYDLVKPVLNKAVIEYL